jgi:hypothetical protein
MYKVWALVGRLTESLGKAPTKVGQHHRLIDEPSSLLFEAWLFSLLLAF